MDLSPCNYTIHLSDNGGYILRIEEHEASGGVLAQMVGGPVKVTLLVFVTKAELLRKLEELLPYDR